MPKAVHVPLLVKAPGQQSSALEDEPISLAAVSDLVLRTIAASEGGLPNSKVSLAAEGVVVAENYFTRPKDLFNPDWGHRFRRVRTVLYEWPYKFIRSSDQDHELYDLSSDPHESRNLIDRRADLHERLKTQLRTLQRLWRPHEKGLPAELTQQDVKELRALGYL